MRKIEEQMCEALNANRNWKLDNTEVRVVDTKIQVLLHGNIILNAEDGFVRLCTCGWKTNTTQSRLSAILQSWGMPRIASKKGSWLIGSEKFDGDFFFTYHEYGSWSFGHEKKAKDFDATKRLERKK